MAEHKAENAEETGVGICRTCSEPIWRETGTVGHRQQEGWSDRIERGGDSIVCFSAVAYRHVPIETREAYIYDLAFERGRLLLGLDTASTPPPPGVAARAEWPCANYTKPVTCAVCGATDSECEVTDGGCCESCRATAGCSHETAGAGGGES